MNIVLMAPIDTKAGIHNWGAPALGIIRIVSYLRSKLPWVNVETYDCQIDFFDPIEHWRGQQIDILGISLLHYTLFESMGVIHRWKEAHPESLIVVGGNEAGANFQQIFENCPIDIAVTAEGEETMKQIIEWREGIRKLDSVDGIIYRKFAIPITDDKLWDYWKYVDFSQFRYDEYWAQIAKLYEEPDYEKIRYVRLLTTSHCMRNCSFCSLAKIRNFACGNRVKPAMLTGQQIMTLVNHVHHDLPDVRTIYYVSDDIFYPSPKPFLDFCELYKKTNYDYRVLIQTSSYSLQYDYFPLLESIGCKHITIGVENASEAMRKEFNKPQDSAKLEKFIGLGRKHGIAIYYLIILIPPAATIESLVENYSTINRWLDEGVQISIEPLVYSYRGTPVYDDIRYQSSRVKREIPGTGRKVTDSEYVLPTEPTVREIALEMARRKDQYIDDYFKKLPTGHKFKGLTSKPILLLLGELLREHGVKVD